MKTRHPSIQQSRSKQSHSVKRIFSKEALKSTKKELEERKARDDEVAISKMETDKMFEWL